MHRSLETLDVRFDRMCTNASVLASRLAGHPAVASVVHPGLDDYLARDIAQKQMLRTGSLIGVTRLQP